MKKFQILALSAIASVGVAFTACDGAGATGTSKASLKTQSDSLSYAYGVQLAESGLGQYLNQLGVVQDTAQFRMNYMQKVAAEQDPTKKAALEKQLSSKLDSLNKANTKNLALFIKGLNESVNGNQEQESYLKGLQVGGQIKEMSQNFETQILEPAKINKQDMLAGLIGALKHEKPVIANASEMIQAKASEAQAKAQEKQEEEMKKQFGPQIEAGEKFLAENKTKADVVTLPSGLQYKVLKEGNGPKPTAGERVQVYYKGSLIDGEVFDSNMGQPTPAVLGVGQVIKGWTEALQLMPVGSKWMLYIPYNLGYGAQQSGKITPFSTLVFEVELVGIDK